MSQVLLRGGKIIDVASGKTIPADVAVRESKIVAIGDLETMQARTVIDCTGRLVLPGFIDAHSHADAKVFDREVQLALLRQGVTTIVVGQDGVSFAPGSGKYASEYFAALNGTHEHFTGGSVRELLDSYGPGRTAINVAYLVPHGTIRAEVMGLAITVPRDEEIVKMRTLVENALEEGAVGLSSGMDYYPGALGLTDELASLCAPLRGTSAVYVSHLRGGYEHNAHAGIAELEEVARRSGVRAHASHYHGPAQQLMGLIDQAFDRGVDLTFDSYPYSRGFTLLGPILLPPSIQQLGVAGVVAALDDSSIVHEIGRSFADSVDWADGIHLAHVAGLEHAWAEGLTLTETANRLNMSPFDAAMMLLRESRLAVSAVFEMGRLAGDEDVAALSCHSRHMTGSDGIYVGSKPHPRGWGTFARMLGHHTRERGDWKWGDAVEHLSARPAERFALGRRGVLEVGAVADIVVIDPNRVADRATYSDPRAPAVGVDDVLVNGEIVLRNGDLTGTLSGTGLRRS